MPRWGLNHALHHAPYCFYLAIPVSARERLRGAVAGNLGIACGTQVPAPGSPMPNYARRWQIIERGLVADGVIKR